MRILFDQGVPVPTRGHLANHDVDTAFQRKWATLSNGALLDRAEADGHHVLVTRDQNLRHRHNLAGRQPATVVLLAASWPRIEQRVDEIVAAVGQIAPSHYIEARG